MLVHFWFKMVKFGDLSSTFLKTNARFETNTFEILCYQNFVKIRKSILLDPKCPYLRIWTQNFQKLMSDMKSAHLKQGTCKISLKDQKVYTSLLKIPKFGYLCSKFKNENNQKILGFPNLEILSHFGSCCKFFVSFWLVSGRFLLCWLVPGFNKYGF